MAKNPGCGPCIGVINYLKSKLKTKLGPGAFEQWVQVHDITEEPDVGDFVRSLNYTSSPVIYFRGDHIQGMHVKKLDEYIDAVCQKSAAA